MNNKSTQGIIPRMSDQLHPLVHVALAGLAFSLVFSAWLFFAQGGNLDLDLGVASVLFFIITAVPTALYLLRRKLNVGDGANRVSPSWRAWLSGDFDMSQGRRKNVTSSIEILLPMMAAVIGITAIGIVFRLTEAGSSLL